jgi:hypothetical protein
MSTGVAPPADEEVLRQYLEPAVLAAAGGRATIAGIDRRRFDLTTSYAAEVLTVRLDTGAGITVFLKDFGSSVRPKDGPRQRREREVRVYQELLAGAGLGTAAYYGSVLDEDGGRLWLLLEYVDGTPVGYCDLDFWAPAAAGLGRMHGHFAGQRDRLRACDFLVRHTADFFHSRAELALRDVGRIAPALAGHLAAVVGRYAPVVAAMTAQPVTLLHGGCRPSNILIRVAADPDRVCILDWEEAALGATLLDVAYLLDGVAPPVLDRLLAAYRQGAGDYGLSLPPPAEMKYLVGCFRLHMTLNSLSQGVLKGYKEKDVAKLLAIAEGLSGRASRRAP